MNRSVPFHPSAPPRPLTDRERRGLVRVADALIPARGEDSSPSETPAYDACLDRALAARGDVFDDVVRRADALADLDAAALDAALRRLHAGERGAFDALSAVVCGAYLTAPAVCERIGYPGQVRRPAPFDQIAEELESGILDAVIARGPIFTPAPE